MAAMFANTATMGVAQGQVFGMRSRRRRPPWVSWAGTSRNRYRTPLGSQDAKVLASPVRARRRVHAGQVGDDHDEGEPGLVDAELA